MHAIGHDMQWASLHVAWQSLWQPFTLDGMHPALCALHFMPQVDVDVYRRLGPVRDVPLGGAPSFTSGGRQL